MDTKEFEGKDLEEAIGAAAAELGRPASEIDYEIVEGGRKGVFGLGARLVRIRVASAGHQPAAPRRAAEAPIPVGVPEPAPRLPPPPPPCGTSSSGWVSTCTSTRPDRTGLSS